MRKYTVNVWEILTTVTVDGNDPKMEDGRHTTVHDVPVLE